MDDFVRDSLLEVLTTVLRGRVRLNFERVAGRPEIEREFEEHLREPEM